jgi:hypothetical protein
MTDAMPSSWQSASGTRLVRQGRDHVADGDLPNQVMVAR